MKYLSGCVRKELCDDPNFGFMMTPYMGNKLEGQTWAADNGCFTHPDAPVESYFSWLEGRRTEFSSCLFATAHDVVGDAVATLARSIPLLPRIRELGLRAALVGQDGLENLEIPWERFDALFIGGTTEWKLSDAARNISLRAKELGKWLHMGRVNSNKRIQIAKFDFDCDSVDGTYVAFGPSVNIPRLQKWMTDVNSFN
jgi:hypothetical protein